jgi:hypothetical protein
MGVEPLDSGSGTARLVLIAERDGDQALAFDALSVRPWSSERNSRDLLVPLHGKARLDRFEELRTRLDRTNIDPGTTEALSVSRETDLGEMDPLPLGHDAVLDGG